jgi:manganese/zinc/iron transport system substrate-binding protein
MGLAAAGCSPAGGSDSHESGGSPGRTFKGEYPMRVVCTTGMVAEMVRRVGGENVQVEALMGPGIDPHLYSPVPSDVRKLAEADIVFYSGLHLEGRMATTFVQMARNKAAYAVTEGLETRKDERLREPPDFGGLYDPHVWHDPAMWADCAKDVGDMMAEFDPQHAEAYRHHAAEYEAELKSLDEYCRQEIEKIPKENRVLITAHDAFGYFGKTYGIEVHGLKGVSTEEEKDLKRQQEIVEMIVKRKVPAVFVESAVAPKAVEAIVEPCKALGWDVKIGGLLYADALGPAGTPDETYAGMLKANVRTIVEALGGAKD